jgi:hypothetical protein
MHVEFRRLFFGWVDFILDRFVPRRKHIDSSHGTCSFIDELDFSGFEVLFSLALTKKSARAY